MAENKHEEDKDLMDSEVFDIQRIRSIVELMKEHDLSEIDLRHASKRIKMRRGNDQTVIGMSAVPQVSPAAATSPVAQATSGADSAEDNATYIHSPMVGTFYSKPKPDSPAFTKVGDHVEADTVVCLIEAMKMFNEIPAGIAGKILEVMVKNEEPVDVNKPLFRIEPS